MNILFLLKSLETGGLEVVTAVLANKFVAEGHRVCVFSFLDGKNSVVKRFCDKIDCKASGSYSTSERNIEALRNILIDNKIDIIVNQWGLPLIPIKVARRAAKGLDIKIISVYHNAPSFNGRTQKMNIALMECENPMKRVALHILRYAYKQVTSHAMAYIYKKSNLFLVLSDCYVKEFKKFTGIKDTGRLSVMTNPVTIDNSDFLYDVTHKEKDVLYVGRLDFVQKRVYRVIDTWNYLEDEHPDWRLTIVGDGDDRENLEKHVKALGLKRVSFVGFKNPVGCYKRASVLMLTSDFEGFPLVLAECMSFGVVPVVYGSYSAVYDIIEDGKDGFVIPYNNSGFRAEQMAERLAYLMTDEAVRHDMATAAIRKSKKYSIDIIYQQWMNVLNGLIYRNGK